MDGVRDVGPSPAAWDALEARHAGTDLVKRCTVEGAALLVRGPAYLATPYTRLVTDQAGRFDFALSWIAASRAALVMDALVRHGVSAWSPIVQAHAMIRVGRTFRPGPSWHDPLDPLDVGFWENWCRPWLDAAAVVIVPDLPGWQQSDGVWAEAHVALARQRKVLLLEVAG